MTTQLAKLIDLFRTKPTITVRDIDDILKANSPRKLISTLRDKGFPIKDRWIEHEYPDRHTVRFKEYWVDPEFWKEREKNK